MIRFLSLLLIFISLSAQQADNFRYKRANNYYRSGKYKLAETISRDLYKRQTDNIKYFRLYKDILLRLKKNSDAINIIKFRLLNHPQEKRLKNELAALYFDMDQKNMAFRYWDELLKQNLKTNDYSEIANAMLRRRLTDRSIQVYKLAQRKLKNKSIFASNIPRIYEMSFNYDKAFLAYIDYLRLNKRNLSYVRRQVLKMLERPEAKKAALKNLDQLNESSENELQLKADLLIANTNYQAAFKLLKAHQKKHAQLLLKLAQNLAKIPQYGLAEEIFEFIVQSESAQRNQALIGLLNAKIERSKKLLGSSQDSLFRDIDACLKRYHRNKNSRIFDLIYATHLLEQRNDLDQAEDIFLTIAKAPRLSSDFRNKVYFQLGRISFFRHDFTKSRSYFNFVTEHFLDGKKLLYLSSMDLLNGEDSKKYLNAFLRSQKGLKNSNLNDALKILIELSHLAKEMQKKKLYSESLFFFLRSQVDSCVNSIDRLQRLMPSFKLSAERFKYELYVQNFRYESALKLALRNKKSKQKDEWMLRIAKLYLKEGKEDLARKELEACILEFPNAFWTIEARRLLLELEAS